MSYLIDRQAALDVFKNLIDTGGIFTEEPLIGGALIAVREAIAQLPAAERKRGKWKPNKDDSAGCGFFVCSVCGADSYDAWDFCPYCGADMRGEE